MSKPTNVIVTIDKQHLDDLPGVANKLSNDGLHVSDIKDYGLIFGQVDSSRINVIRNHSEVNDVAEESYVQLPHPDSDIQ